MLRHYRLWPAVKNLSLSLSLSHTHSHSLSPLLGAAIQNLSSSSIQAKMLTKDHKPEDPDETRQIESLGKLAQWKWSVLNGTECYCMKPQDFCSVPLYGSLGQGLHSAVVGPVETCPVCYDVLM